MSVCGKWALASSEGLDAFLVATGADMEKIAPMKAALELTGANGYVEELQIDGEKLHRKVFIGGNLTRDKTVPINSEVDAETLDGKPCKLMVKVNGNQLVREETVEGGHVVKTVVDAEGDTATMVMSFGGTSYTRIYKKC